MALLDTLLQTSSTILEHLFPILEEMWGMETEIFYPVSNDSIYGSQDMRYTYAATPDLTGKFICIGIIGEKFISDGTGDIYGTEHYMIVSASAVVQEKSKVIIKLSTTKFFGFMVNSIRGLTGDNGFLYQKLDLVPLEIAL